MATIKNEFDHLLAYPADTTIVKPLDFTGSDKVELSGRVLNVMTVLPTRILRVVDDNGGPGQVWAVEGVRGNSALYSLHFFLEQQTEWESHLIAWTGELVVEGLLGMKQHGGLKEEDSVILDEGEKLLLEKEIRRANKTDNIHPIWLLDAKGEQRRWRRYAENVLWPVFHYIQGLPSDGKAENEYWHDYVRFNEAYLDKIKQVYRPGDIVWIHDYYLLLLPQLLRTQFPDIVVGLFLHTPFPSSEYFRCLSKRTQILDGMLGADKVVFQSESFQRHFISCCSRLQGCEVNKNKIIVYGFSVATSTLPIGIDTKKIEHDAFSTDSDIDEKVKALREIYTNKKIIVGRDRLDSVRGVVQKLQAFEMFLHMYPEWRDNVVLIQVSTPGYSHSREVEKKVTELVNHINSEYGSIHSIPVLHYQKFINKDEYLALLRIADVGLITSVRDGMNTTSLEFVICQKENNSPLIISEFSGTASVLKDALLVNPWDSVRIAKTINDCFCMTDDEKMILEQKLYRQVTSNTVQNWTNNFMVQLIEQAGKGHESHHTPMLNRSLLYDNYKKSNRRLFLFDYDGTLTPIVNDPAAAIPSPKLNQILKSLSADPKNQIWIISGRDEAFLEKWFGTHDIGLSAEHGCFMKTLGSHKWVNLAASFDMSWQSEVEAIFKEITAKTPGSNIERKKVALTWHYRRADPELGVFQAQQCKRRIMEQIVPRHDVEVMEGKANIEVRPKFVNKGEIVKRLVLLPQDSVQDLTIAASPDTKHDRLPDFTLCIGDDQTDEDMFRALNTIELKWDEDAHIKNDFGSHGIYPVAIGPSSKMTVATAHLSNPSQVLETLALLAGHTSLPEAE